MIGGINMENRFGNLLSIMLIVAIVIVIGILSFFGYKVYTSNKTNKEAEFYVYFCTCC